MRCDSQSLVLYTTVGLDLTGEGLTLDLLTSMGRSSTKSVARIYPDVNARLGPSWHEYGSLPFLIFGNDLML